MERLNRLGQYQKAYDLAQARLSSDSLSDEQRMAIAAGVLDAAVGLSKYDLASLISDDLYKTSQSFDTPACTVRSLWAQIILATNHADFVGAEQKALEALAITQSLSGTSAAHDRLMARIHRSRADAYRWSNQPDRSMAEHQTALQLWRRASDPWGESGELINIAILESLSGDIGSAIETSEVAERMLRKINASDVLAHALENLAAFHYQLGQDAKAVSYLKEVLNISHKTGNIASEGVASLHLGRLELAAKEFQKASASFNLAERLIDPKNQWLFHLELLIARADLAAAQSDGATALGYANSCLQIASSRDDPVLIAECSLAQSGALQVQGQVAESTERARFALMIGEQFSLPGMIYSAAATLQAQHAWLGENREAIRYGKRAVAAMLELRDSMNDRSSSTLQASLIDSRRDLMVRLADLLLGEGRYQEAQQVLRLLKLQDMNAYLRETRGAAGEEQALPATSDETQWRLRYDQLASALRQDADDVSTLLDSARRRFLDFLKDKAPSKLDSQTFDPSPATTAASAWRARLSTAPAGTILVQYLIAPNRLDILLTSRDEQIARSVLTEGGVLGRSIGPFLRAVRDPRSDALVEGQAAYQVLMAAIDADLVRLGAKTLWLSLDGVLRYVPFAALHDGKQWLVQRYSTVVIAEALGPPPADRTPHRKLGAGFGVSRAMEGFEALRNVPNELNSIFAVGSADKTNGRLRGRVYLDKAFTRSALQLSLKQETPVIHIATHFKLAPGSEVDSYLLLGDGHRLSVKDLRDSSLPFGKVDLLTLSACDTAVDGDGNELEGLSSVAQQKGARTVVASLWQVSDVGTEQLMRRFYAHLGELGFDRALALQRAQQSFLQAETIGPAPDPKVSSKNDKSMVSVLAHPYIWAAFVAMGAAR